jgi:uncharacterized membrane protein
MSRKIKILTIVSLLLNVLLIGVVIGDISHRFGREPYWRKHSRDLTSRLPEDKAELFRKTLEEVYGDNRDVYKEIKEARGRAMEILSAPEFDEAAYREEVDRIHELKGLMKRRLADATVELAKQFDQEERKALSEQLRRPPRRSRDGSSRHSSNPSGPESSQS